MSAGKKLAPEIACCCPKCGGMYFLVLAELKCAKVVCGYTNGTQIPPHSSESYVKNLLDAGRLQGCGTPFTISGSGETTVTVYG